MFSTDLTVYFKQQIKYGTVEAGQKKVFLV